MHKRTWKEVGETRKKKEHEHISTQVHNTAISVCGHLQITNVTQGKNSRIYQSVIAFFPPYNLYK